MIFIGLLIYEQKQAGYFVAQDEDFVWLWHRRNGNPNCIGIFLYSDVRVKDIRGAADRHRVEQKGARWN